MIKDKLLELASAQAVTTSAASTNIIDQGAANPASENAYMICQVCEAVTAAGAATVTFAIETSVDAAFTTPIALFTSAAIPKASLGLNAEPLKINIPNGTKRYIRAYFTIGTGPLTAGKFDVFIAKDADLH